MKKIAVGLSGGVDSAVAAYLLKEQGNEVIGVTLKMWDGVKLSGSDDIDDAAKICEHLGIEHRIVDLTSEFRKEVMDYFVSEYLAGRTPNPCCRCNRMIKFRGLIEWAKKNGIDYIATGHYAKIICDDLRYTVSKSVTDTKDQTYALYNLTQEELAHTLMPLGDYTKDEIRAIAEKIALPVASKKDSQDICFIPDGDYAKFIREHAGEYNLPGPGNFVTEDGKILGTHTGYTDYTIGQRKGLNIAAGHRVFVKEIRPETNEVIISDEDVYGTSLIARDINLMGIEIEEFMDTFATEGALKNISEGMPEGTAVNDGVECGNSFRAFAKIRYAHKGEWCTVSVINTGSEETDNADTSTMTAKGEGSVVTGTMTTNVADNSDTDEVSDDLRIICTFDHPVRAITPGQSVVFYDNDTSVRKILCGGIISNGN